MSAVERTIEAIILGVEPKVVRRRSDNQEITLYDIQVREGTNDFKVTAGRRETAEDAWKLLNKVALLHIKEEQSGMNPHTQRPYTNRYLQTVHGTPDLPTMRDAQLAQPAQDWSQPPTTSTNTKAAPSGNFLVPTLPAPALPEAGLSGQAKDLSIMRQTATKVAAHLSGTPHEFQSNVAMLLRFYQTGEWSDENASKVEQAAEQAPAFPGTSPAHSPDDDIPF